MSTRKRLVLAMVILICVAFSVFTMMWAGGEMRATP